MKKLIGFAVLMCANSAFAQSGDEDDLALAYGDAATVKIATGTKQSLRRAPAVASVFTADDIRAMGATDISQVLERVPGLHIGKSFYLYDPRYLMRGIGGDLSQQILVLIDGVRRQSPTAGTPEEAWVDMPIDRIARIEVIRGPGSALYGADAFSGVISITTYTGEDFNGTRGAAIFGSQDTRAYSLMHGDKSGDFSWFAYMRAGRTEGSKRQIEVDAQTVLDSVFQTRASLAPGYLDNGSKAFDGALGFTWGSWTIRADTKVRRDVGTGTGLAGALTNRDDVDVRTSTLSSTYQKTDISPGWDLYSQLSFTHHTGDTYYQLYPPGGFGGLYPDGMVGQPGRSTRVLAGEVIGTYSGWANHRIRVGAGAQHSHVYDVRDARNFDFVFLPTIGIFPQPIGALTNVSKTAPYMPQVKRTTDYILVQDEWNFSKDYTLTTGVRYDRYSDFGATINPRIALVWDARHDLTVKAMLGRAFRAPTFSELYTINNPVQLGNPKLAPETILSREIVAEWQLSPRLLTRFNLFLYQMRDVIRLQANANPASGSSNANRGDQRGRGVEAEFVWNVDRNARVEGSFSQQRSVDELNNYDAGYAPHQMFKLSAHVTLPYDFELNLQGLNISNRSRAYGDRRPPIANYHQIDVALGWRQNIKRGWSGVFGIRNLLDTDAREPSPSPGSIRYDFPLLSRQIIVQARYTY
nr:TonB-dependent receptor [uncultured Undibacterium sp.]